MKEKASSKFGKFVVDSIRNRALEQNQMLLEGKLKGHSIQSIQERVLKLDPEIREIIREIVVDAFNTATHDFLFAVQDAHDRELGIEVFVDGLNVAEASGMLHGECVGEDGWIERFSDK